MALARHGYLAIDIQVHGDEVDLPHYQIHPGYYDSFVYEPVEQFYFYRVYLNALQAVNYLASRPDVDASRIVAVGGSQGGRLSVVVGALDPRIKAIVPAIPHFANHPYLVWADACNACNEKRVPDLSKAVDGMDVLGPPADDTPRGRCLAYYDIMNFAPDVTCPVMMNAGLIDFISPPSGVWPTFLRLGSADKTLVPLPGMAHDWSAEFDRRAWRWLDRTLKIPAKSVQP